MVIMNMNWLDPSSAARTCGCTGMAELTIATAMKPMTNQGTCMRAGPLPAPPSSRPRHPATSSSGTSMRTLLSLTNVATPSAPSETLAEAPYTWASSKMLAPTVTPKPCSSSPGSQPARYSTG